MFLQKTIVFSLRNQLCPLVNEKIPVEVLLMKSFVGQIFAINVSLSNVRTPAVDVTVNVHANNLVLRKKSVKNPLLQAVSVNRRAKISFVAHVGSFFGRGSQVDVNSESCATPNRLLRCRNDTRRQLPDRK